MEISLDDMIWLQGADRPWPDRQWALCIFDDLLEHTGPVCHTSCFVNDRCLMLALKAAQSRPDLPRGWLSSQLSLTCTVLLAFVVHNIYHVSCHFCLYWSIVALNALTPLFGFQEGHLAFKKFGQAQPLETTQKLAG